MTFEKEKIAAFNQLLESSRNIVITSHKGPDGDSIGSSLGLYHYLVNRGFNVRICHPDPAPSFLHWMPAYDHIKNLEDHPAEVEELFSKADLIFCLDYNSPGRIGKMEPFLVRAAAKKIMVDHHRDPDTEFCDLMFSDPGICSTSEMIVEIILASGDQQLLNESIGDPLYCGIMTDTGSFRFSSTTARTHEIVAILIRGGVKHWKVHENVFDSGSLDRIQLWSYALLEKLVIKKEFKTAYITITEKEEERFNAIKGDTEGLVNQPLGIDGILVSVFLKEAEGIIKMSFRSKDFIPVNDLAREYFDGGGHLNASGGRFIGKLEDAIAKLETVLPQFYAANKAEFS